MCIYIYIRVFWEKAFSNAHGVEGLTTFCTYTFERTPFKSPNQLFGSRG